MELCEIVWVRCREPREDFLRVVPRGMRVSIVEKCGEHGQGSALEVRNVGEEGFGYSSFIVARWDSLPACAFLVHGGWRRRATFWDGVATLFGCVRRPVSNWTSKPMAIPLAHMWRPDRMLVGSGLGVFYHHLRDVGVDERVFPDLKSTPLSYYATNSWLVSRPALQQKPRAFWDAMRSASLLSGQWRGFAEMGVGKLHSEMGLIYEHLFHVALGLDAAARESEAWRVRAEQARRAFATSGADGCRGPVALFECNSSTRCSSADCRAQWPKLCEQMPAERARRGSHGPKSFRGRSQRRMERRRWGRRSSQTEDAPIRSWTGYKRSWANTGRSSWDHSANHQAVPAACVHARPTTDRSTISSDCFLVVLAHAGEDVRWLSHASVPYVLINKSTVPNVGLDASTYLWFIVRNYERLPWFTYFTHAHEYAWHHNAYSQRASMFIAIEQSGLGFLNTAHNRDGDMLMAEFNSASAINWSEQSTLRKTLLGLNTPLAADCVVQYPPCATMWVRRDRILAHPRSFYEKLFRVMTDATHPQLSRHAKGEGHPGRMLHNHFLEPYWHWIFGEPELYHLPFLKYAHLPFVSGLPNRDGTLKPQGEFARELLKARRRSRTLDLSAM